MHEYRSHYCSELNISNLDQEVKLSGWIDTIRDHGNLIFIDLRDNYGKEKNDVKIFQGFIVLGKVEFNNHLLLFLSSHYLTSSHFLFLTAGVNQYCIRKVNHWNKSENNSI